MYLWHIDTAADWLNPDKDGKLVSFPSDSVFYNLAESQSLETHSTGKESELTMVDIFEFENQLEEALALVEDDQVNLMYFAWSIGFPSKVNEEILNV